MCHPAECKALAHDLKTNKTDPVLTLRVPQDDYRGVIGGTYILW